MLHLNKTQGTNLSTWFDLHAFSVKHRNAFWTALFNLYPPIYSGSFTRAVDESARMDAVPRWFEGVELNFAETSLLTPDPADASKGTTHRKEDWRVAVTEVREGGTEIRECTWKEVRERVALLGNAMRARGVKKGDRVAIVASNSIDSLVVFFAITSLGGLFSSSSTDMGTKGVLDRLKQIRPKFVFVDDWALYNGKTTDLRPKMGEIEEGLRQTEGFEGLVSMPRTPGKPRDISQVKKCETLARFLSAAKGDQTLRFTRVPFGAPFLIVYSSGTTGMPKCIVHSVGGVLLNSRKEANLHRDAAQLSPDDMCVLQFTTTGWIMYLTSIMSLTNGMRAILYDGSPFQPDLTSFLKLVESQKVTDFGISPRFLSTLATANPPIKPREIMDLSRLRRVTSTGMVLSEAQFEWFYDEAFPPHVQLDNISGGTDLAGCFTMGNMMLPVYCGGTVAPALGMALEAYDQTIEGGKGVKGKPLPAGEAGEMVCTKGFPTQPVMFWDDHDGERYFNSYYARFDNVWTHGDFISFHPVTGGVTLHGRADGVLNPSGVRFGSAEIYSVIENWFHDEVADSICVGQRRPQDLDESVLLFLLMKEGKKFTKELVQRVKDAIARDCGKRCVPKYVFETPEIPVSIVDLISFPRCVTKWLTFAVRADHDQPQEGGTSCQANRVREDDQAERYFGQQGVFEFLLSICEN
jgi:acetoacetyl-CoA synthetase